MANKTSVADHTRTTPLMRSFGFGQEPEGEFRGWVSQGLDSYTYFAVGSWTGRIKIGKSKDPWGRMRQLWLAKNGEDATLAVVLRGECFETAYHRAFAPHSHGNEWFLPHPDILEEIELLRAFAGADQVAADILRVRFGK